MQHRIVDGATVLGKGRLQGRPMRGRSHAMTTSCGVRRRRGRSCRSTADFVKASACRSVSFLAHQ
jgi:hypothetical protein